MKSYIARISLVGTLLITVAACTQDPAQVELKGQNADLDKPQNRANDKHSPVEQAFGYAQHSSKKSGLVQWILVSNYKEFRLTVNGEPVNIEIGNGFALTRKSYLSSIGLDLIHMPKKFGKQKGYIPPQALENFDPNDLLVEELTTNSIKKLKKQTTSSKFWSEKKQYAAHTGSPSAENCILVPYGGEGYVFLIAL